jgi:hypothetical protein
MRACVATEVVAFPGGALAGSLREPAPDGLWLEAGSWELILLVIIP